MNTSYTTLAFAEGFVALIVCAIIAMIMLKSTIGHFIGKKEKGVHGDIARSIVKKAIGSQKKPAHGDTIKKAVTRKLRKTLFGGF